VTHILKAVAAKAPNFIANTRRFGTVRLYRVKPMRGSHSTARGSYRMLAFSSLPVNETRLRGTIVHELVHVADPYGRIANSTAWKTLAHPLIYRLRAVLKQHNLSTRVNPRNPREHKLAEAAGLPSFYAAASINEALAEITAARINGWYTPPPAIDRFLKVGLLSPPPPGPYVEQALQRGRQQVRDKQYDGALSTYNGLIKGDETFYGLYGLRGRAYFAMKKLTHANQDFTRALSLLSPYETVTRPQYLEIRARTWLGLKKYTESERDCRTVIRTAPRSARGHLICALASLSLGKYKQSVSDFETLLKIAPGFEPRISGYLARARRKLQTGGKN
jgi:tetratricopeptide (TPR) repeat protein